jgi:biopolymer transport protein ExbD
MSVSVEGSDQDFDLNIAPIIDCFTVLIAYLLISASFISIGFFDVGVSTTSEVTEPSKPAEPQEMMSVAIGAGESLELKLSGPETATIDMPGKGGRRDYDGLLAQVKAARSRWPALSDASVKADSQIEYREVIQTIEQLKKEVPKVFVGE